jgi:hypothetical protein
VMVGVCCCACVCVRVRMFECVCVRVRMFDRMHMLVKRHRHETLCMSFSVLVYSSVYMLFVCVCVCVRCSWLRVCCRHHDGCTHVQLARELELSLIRLRESHLYCMYCLTRYVGVCVVVSLYWCGKL